MMKNPTDFLLDGFEPEKTDKKSLKFILLRYLKYWYLYLLGISFSLGLAYLYFMFAVPQYPASTTILINATTRGSDFGQNAVYSELESYQSIKTVENEAEVLASVSLMNLVMKDLDFRVSVFRKDNIFRRLEVYGSQMPLQVSFYDYDSLSFYDSDLDTKFSFKLHNSDSFELINTEGVSQRFVFGDTIRKPFGSFSVTKGEFFDPNDELNIVFENPYSLTGRYASRLDVFVVNKLASVIRVSLTDPVPLKATLVLDKLIEVYNREAVRNKNLTAVTTLEFIEEQLENVRSELRQIEAKEEKYKRDNQITELSENALQYSNNAESFRNQLSSFNIRLEVLESIEKYIFSQDGRFQAVPSTMDIEDPTLNSLVAQYNELQSERERMLRTVQPESPLVQNLNDQITNVRRGLLDNLKSIKGNLEISRNNLLGRVNQLDFQSSRVPEIERQLVEITREKITKQDHYNYLIEKREEAAMSLAATTVSNSRIIDKASASSTPSKPNKLLIVVFALVLGIGVPFGFVVGKYQLTDKILSKEDISSKTSRSILGEIMHKKGKEIKVIGNSKRTALAEQFRSIRTNVQFALPSHDKMVIMVTSGLPGEGKSFIALNLAVSFALTGKSVAICEFDLRRPSLLESVNLSARRGISDYIVDSELQISDISTQDDSICENLTFFGCGTLPENPSEIMMAPKVIHFVEMLKKEYDVIIFDTAPVGQVADAYSLSRFVDLSVFVMRYNYTPVNTVDLLNDDYKDRKLKNPMIILNDAKDLYNSIYGYGYKYGYYEQEDKKKSGYTRRQSEKEVNS
ncbi:GumC family protein [Lunatibacter salilacus]|uniref:GumC family protein n=1 Tax=Lunatibacter salilacus TaxID=2483804 RepID=UPI00131B4E0D|nr:tyrosine-protein kinase [Lunatibacter salilacus]